MSKNTKNENSPSFDPLALIENSISQGLDPSVIQEIDERDLNWCPNVARWVLDHDYLGAETIYPLQLQVMLRLFGDVCPYCSDWEFYSRDWEVLLPVGNALDRLQLLEFGQCPKCHTTRTDHYREGFWNFPEELDLCWGMRAGKSAVVGMVASYVLHRYLKIPDPAAYFNLLRGSLLVMRFVALTAGQASESIWHQFVRSVENCTWFNQYHDFLRGHEKRLGVELVKVMTQYIAYPHKKLTAYYLGASIDSSRGRTAFFTAFDEIGWWLGSEAAKRANASETYAAYEKSSRTVRNNAMSKFKRGHHDVPTAILAAVSSTSSKTDFMMRLIRQSKTDKKKVGSHKASWEVNPEFAINPEELKVERERNPKTFNRDYGSVPPFADDPFFDNEEAIQKITKLETPSWLIHREESPVGIFINASSIDRNDSVPYILSIDLGKNYSGYAAALMKLRDSDFSVAQVAGLFALYPRKGENIDLSSMFHAFIKKLCEKLKVVMVVYDQWQSKTQIDELKNLGIRADSYSLTYANFTHFRTSVGQQKLEIPYPEMPMNQAEASSEALEEILYARPYLHLIWQMLSVSEVGNKVTKGDGHDDLFRAVVLGCRYLWHENYRALFEYKAGMAYMRRDQRTTKGRLALAGGSRGSGQLYSPTGGQGGNTASSPMGRPLGVVVPRTQK